MLRNEGVFCSRNLKRLLGTHTISIMMIYPHVDVGVFWLFLNFTVFTMLHWWKQELLVSMRSKRSNRTSR